jgi:uncharacterized protein (TIGR01244 family)
MNQMRISNDVSVGAQPTVDDLKTLVEQGFNSIVNLRAVSEEDQPLSPEREGEVVRQLGIEYVHFPVAMNDMRAEKVDEFRQRLGGIRKPAFVHCHIGKRAGAFVMMDLAIQNQMTGEQTLDQARQLGFQCDQPMLMQFVKQYVDQRRSK